MCVFWWGAGIHAYGGQAHVSSCIFENQSVFGVGAGNTFVAVEDCRFSNVHVGIQETESGNRLEIDSCEFFNVTIASYIARYNTMGFFHNCLLDKGERYVALIGSYDKLSVLQDGDEDNHFDMTLNWWGTTEPDSIQAWIKDRHDYPEYPFYPVFDFLPFKTEPVATEKQSLGGFRAMFRKNP